MKTTNDLKREGVEEILTTVLKKNLITLHPTGLTIRENFTENRTCVDFSFDSESSGKRKNIEIKKAHGAGFVDAIFTACSERFSLEHSSLKNISLIDVVVKPDFFSSKKSLGTDASTRITFRIKVARHGISEFSSQSCSIVGASYKTILSAFQFYMNCDKAFKKVQATREDALTRNRADIVQRCLYDLSKLTEVNTYNSLL